MIKRLLDVVLYFAIGGIFVGSFLLYIIYSPPDSELDFRWFGFLMITFVIFGFIFQWYWKYLLRKKFRNTLLIFFVIHVGFWLALFFAQVKTSGLVFGMAVPIEVTLMLPILERAKLKKPKAS